MRQIRGLHRFPHRPVLVLAVLALVFGLPLAGHSAAALAAAAPSPASAASAAAAPSAAQGAAEAATRLAGTTSAPVAAVTTAARQPAPQGGVCGVPGIGDIGSLLGFCQLGSSGLSGDLNNICQPSVPTPEPANAGIDAMVKPPASGKQPATLYGSYGIAGQYWAATNLQCSDMTSLIGNNVASMVFDIAKSIDRVTITVYQSAAGQGILSWLSNVVDKLISSLGNAIYFPYLALVVIFGAMWLAWQGLIRKRATRTIEGTVWMVVACAAAIWLIGRPGDFTGIGSSVSNGISQTLNVAFAKLPAPSQSNCLPTTSRDPQLQPPNFNFSSGSGVVDQNANELWTVLVCKPWLAGEFGTTAFAAPGAAPSPVNIYGRQLLWSQAIAVNEKPTTALIQAKQATYQGIASSIQKQNPGVYPLFQGKQWTTRLEIGFAALFAAAIAGVLVLLIAVTLILLKLGFLLLLVVGPFFLLIGTHPGFGRVVALRWFEMLIGVLLKQGAIALVLSVLLYAYSLIMGTSDTVLPWALKILMIALVTIAVFIYRKPFQHLFSAVGYGMIGSRERADIDLERARISVRDRSLGAAAAVVPGMAGYRMGRLGRRGLAQAAGVAAGAAGTGAAATAGLSTADAASLDGENGYAADPAAGVGASDGGRASSRSALASRARARGAAGGEGNGRAAPPLNLPSRGETAAGAAGAAAVAAGAAGAAAGWARGNGSAAATSGRAAASADPAATGDPGRTAPPRPGQAAPVRSQSAQSRPLQSPHVRAAAAAAGAAAATPVPPSPGPASPPPPRPAPSGPAPAGPAPTWPTASSPWRPGVTQRQSQVRPPAGPDPAPPGPAGRSQGGPWADSSAGRQAAPPPRPPAPAPGPGPSARPSGPPARQPSGPVRQAQGPSAGPPPAPSRPPSVGPPAASSRPPSVGPPPAPSRPPFAGPPAASSRPPSVGPPPAPSRPPSAGPSSAPLRRPSGTWSGETAGPSGPAPRQQAGPARPPAPPPARRSGGAPPRPSAGAPQRQRGAAPGRPPGAAPARQRAVTPGRPPGAPPGPDATSPGLPLAGNSDPGQQENPAPFWLRPLRRRK